MAVVEIPDYHAVPSSGSCAVDMGKAPPNLTVSTHPLVVHKLTHMRNPKISSQQFYRLMKEVGMLMAYEVTATLATTQAPPGSRDRDKDELDGDILAGRKPAIVPILRSGLAMAEGLREVMPSVRTGHLGLLQDENHQPNVYLIALPETDNRTFIVVDAIIATGNNALRAIEILQEHGVDEKRIRFCVVQATIEGAYKLFVEHPEISIHAGSLGTLVPGTKEVVPRLGDVGDRLFFGPNN